MSSSRSGASSAPVGSRSWVSRCGTARTTVSASIRSPCGLDGPAAVLRAGDGGRSGAQLGAYSGGVECLAGQRVVDVAERHARPADVGGAGLGQESGLEHLRREGQRGVRRGGVERGDADQVPEGLDGARRLAVPGEPAAEVDGVERGVVRVQAAQRQCGASDARPLAEREMRVAHESGGEVERHRQRVAAQPSQPGPAGRPTSRTGTSKRFCRGARRVPSTRSRNQR